MNENKVKMLGYVLFPKKENERFSMCLATRTADDYQTKIDDICDKVNDMLSYIESKNVKFNDKDYKGFNMKTSYDIPVFDYYTKEKLTLDDVLYGCKCLVECVVKEYEFKRRKGLTLYISGIVRLEQSEQQQVTYESLLEGIELSEDVIQF